VNWSDPPIRIAINFLLIAFVLFVAGYFFGAGKELAAAVVGGLTAAIAPEAARFLTRANLTKDPNSLGAGRYVDSRLQLSVDGRTTNTVGRYVQIPIRNVGSAPAKGARAYLAQASYRKDASASWTSVGSDEPIPLEWGGIGDTEIVIPAGIVHYVNVVRGVQLPRRNALQVCAPSVPFALSDKLEEHGCYKFDIVVTAENAEPHRVSIAVQWLGTSTDLALREDH
jgi:hypothetical protein